MAIEKANLSIIEIVAELNNFLIESVSKVCRKFILANESTVFIFVLTAFISSGFLKNQNPEIFHYGYGVNKDVMVVPEANFGGDVWEFQYQIRINNDKSDYSVVEVVSGELPPGLNVDSTKTSSDRVQLKGKATKEAFPNTWQDNPNKTEAFKESGFNDSTLELLDITYVDKIGGEIIESPSSTFEVGKPLYSTSNESRVISNISTYDDDGVTKTKITVPYVTEIFRNGFTRYEAFDLPRNEIIKNGKLSSNIDPNFKGYIYNGNIFAYYKELKTVYTTSTEIESQHQKDFTFTLGIRSSEGTEYFAQQEFTIRVLQNHDHVRDTFQSFSNYTPPNIYYDPSKKYYVVDFLLPLKKSDGTATSIIIEDGTLTFNTDKEIEAYGILPLYQNDEGKRMQNDITLEAG